MIRVIQDLREYNRWRRGADDIQQPDPKTIGELIDFAADALTQAIDCRLCRHYTIDGCRSTLTCRGADKFAPTAPVNFWGGSE